MIVIRKTAMVTKKLLIRPPRPWAAPSTCGQAPAYAGRRCLDLHESASNGPFRRASPGDAGPLDAATAPLGNYHTVARKFGPGICPPRGFPSPVGRPASRIAGRLVVL